MQTIVNVVPNCVNREIYDDDILSDFVDDMYFTFRLPIWARIDSTWQQIKSVYVFTNGTWNKVSNIYSFDQSWTKLG